jgi:glucose-1-phosphate adenylyltransferase
MRSPGETGNILTFVLAGGAGERLYPLTRRRAKPAVPFGGVYRIVDFTLTNCINSGLRHIQVLVQYKSLSLTRHIRNAWNVVNTALGEYLEVLPPQKRVSENWYLGTADAIYQNMYSIESAGPKNVLILSGDHIYKMNYRKMLLFHEKCGADVTVGAIVVPDSEALRFGILEVDTDLQVFGFEEKPAQPKHYQERDDIALASMGIYIFKTEVLNHVLNEDAARPTSHDFGKDILPALVKHGKVCAYIFEDENKKEAQYWRDVGTIESYWEANMDLVAVDPQFNLYDREWPMHARITTSPPAKFVFNEPGERFGAAVDSIVSSGCIISGGMVTRSVLSPDVRVNSYAHIDESILFGGVTIGRGSRIRRAIIEKGVQIPENTIIGFDHADDQRRFMLSPGGLVVVDNPDL